MAINYNLKELRSAAEAACVAAQNAASDIGGAVNWADLHCCEAIRHENDSGEIGYAVLIEEADPAACRLRDFISGNLRKAGFDGIETCIGISW